MIEIYDPATIRRMIHQCYRDLIDQDGEAEAHLAAVALYEQLTGINDSYRVSQLLVDVWVPGMVHDVATVRPDEQGREDLARSDVIG